MLQKHIKNTSHWIIKKIIDDQNIPLFEYFNISDSHTVPPTPKVPVPHAFIHTLIPQTDPSQARTNSLHTGLHRLI